MFKEKIKLEIIIVLRKLHWNYTQRLTQSITGHTLKEYSHLQTLPCPDIYRNVHELCDWLYQFLSCINLTGHVALFHQHMQLVFAFSYIRDVGLFSHVISLKSNLILSSHLCLGLSSDFYPSGFLSNLLYTFFISIILATCQPILYLLIFTLNTKYEAPHYAFLSTFLLFPLL
jgi:hypothetical protein